MIDSEVVFGTFLLVVITRKAFININVKDYEPEFLTAVVHSLYTIHLQN